MYAIITYITEYFVKDDSAGVVTMLANSLKENESEDLKSKMRQLMNCWVKNRIMGQAEAVYRLIKDFQFRDSDATCVFAHTEPRSERSKILKNATEKPEFQHFPKITVENNKDTVYVEQYDNNSKYERRPKEEVPVLDHLTHSQMLKIYRAF